MAAKKLKSSIEVYPEQNRIGIKKKLDPHHQFTGPYVDYYGRPDKGKDADHLPLLGIGVYNGFVYLNDATVTDSKKLKEMKGKKLVAHYISTEPDECYPEITDISFAAFFKPGYKVVPCYVLNANSQSAFDEPESTPFPSQNRGIDGLAKSFPNVTNLKIKFPFTIWASMSCRGSCLQDIRASRHNPSPAIIPACFSAFPKLNALKIEVFEPTTDNELVIEAERIGRNSFGLPWTITTFTYERKLPSLVDVASKFISTCPGMFRNLEELPTELQDKIEKFKKRRNRDWDES